MESKCYFDVQYFDTLVLDGKWDEAQKYFLSFTKVDDHPVSIIVLFLMAKHKYLEALDRKDMTTAVDTLRGDLKEYSKFNSDLYNELTWLLTMTNFREHSELANYTTHSEGRTMLVSELKMLFMAHPIIKEKTKLPAVERDRLKNLMAQSIKWQHFQCANSVPDITMGSLFEDHRCPSHAVRGFAGLTSAQNFAGSTSGQNIAGSTSGQNFAGSTSGQNIAGSTSGQNIAGSTSGQNTKNPTSSQRTHNRE
ncbi:topless-related protein 2-like [Impatiens glandulifera]|uniref:topless-related protein 2-like n=1 Tax=Impatiens glandulifera TaxID=253017 RepID=UPI001FB06ECE|nr:topless-related protein 2-like [Impatiens glandulifera]